MTYIYDDLGAPNVLVTSIFVLLGQSVDVAVNLLASIYLWIWDSTLNQWSDQPYELDVPTANL